MTKLKLDSEIQDSTLTISEGSVYIPHRFARRVLSHTLLVNLDLSRRYCYPLILAIQGSPGSGKSFQARYTLEYHGFKTITIDSSSLSGSLEGDSIKILRDVYYKLGISNTLSAIIIDDFDISIGAQKPNYERTSNSDILNGFLMHLCDNPVLIDDLKVHPVPIILTGNNLTTLYAPLRRHGRTRIFDWIPSEAERSEIVKHILKDLQVPVSVVNQLLRDYPDKNISFFQQIKSELLEELTIPLLEASRSVKQDRKAFSVTAFNKIQEALITTNEDRVIAMAKQIDVDAKDFLANELTK